MKKLGAFLDKLEVFYNSQHDRIGTLLFSASIVLCVAVFGLTLVNALKPVKVEPVKVEPVKVEVSEPVKVEPVIDTRQDVEDLAKSNGFKPSKRIIDAILTASEAYQIDALELTAIGIIETGLGKYARTRKNSNGTYDKGLFQINTVNYPKCIEYNLDSPEGSALCAAKLLSQIKSKRADYLGVYHSKTPTKKAKYLQKVSQVLALASDN
jgi:hypothetical protein